jgi:hypothetical protein
MSKFDEYLSSVAAEARKLLDSQVSRGKREAQEILEAHVANSRGRLQRWTRLLANQEITKREFRLLVNSQITLGKMRLRTVRVIGKRAALDLRNSLRALFVDKAFEIFL